MKRDAHAVYLPLLALVAAAVAPGTESDSSGNLPEGPAPVVEVDSGAGYSIVVRFPGVIADSPVLEDSLRLYAEGVTEGFLGAVEGADREMPECCLEMVFSHEPSPTGLVCIMASIYEYSGGAHGMYWNTSFVYDELENGFVHPVALLGDAAAFTGFAEEVAKSLLHQMEEGADTGWVLRGTAPSLVNYSAMLPIPDQDGSIAGWLVSFCPYQVAPYAMGSREVIIPEHQF